MKKIQSQNNLLLLKFLAIKGRVLSRRAWAQSTLSWIEECGNSNYYNNLLIATKSINSEFVYFNRSGSSHEFQITSSGERVLALLEPVWVRGKGWFGGVSKDCQVLIKQDDTSTLKDRVIDNIFLTKTKKNLSNISSIKKVVKEELATNATKKSSVEYSWNDSVISMLNLENDPAKVLNLVASNGRIPPEGYVSRALIIAWARSSPLSGGSFKTSNEWGYGMNGRYEEPFLSFVLGRDDRKERVLKELKLNAPEKYLLVVAKLNLVVISAKKSRAKIRGMAMPSMGKGMLNAMYLYGEELLSGVVDVN